MANTGTIIDLGNGDYAHRVGQDSLIGTTAPIAIQSPGTTGVTVQNNGLGIFVGAAHTNIGSGTTDVQVVASTTALRYCGFSCKEDAATAASAEFAIRHGVTATAPILTHVKLGPNESRDSWLGDAGVAAPSGIFVDRISGTSDVAIYSKNVS